MPVETFSAHLDDNCTSQLHWLVLSGFEWTHDRAIDHPFAPTPAMPDKQESQSAWWALHSASARLRQHMVCICMRVFWMSRQ